ncbi:MAG: hypothetical protein C0592_06330 [Marinilabiliales bacterium]|nr:MAG: hypothetical protein C0592_06330 [Marinilabiliales bacterium]
MKRTFLSLIIAFLITSLSAQEINPVMISSDAEIAPGLIQNAPQKGTNALWDIHFSFDASTAAGGDLGMAGVAFINNEYWVSRWANDTLYRFSTAGVMLEEFVITGLSGTRSITTDGTYLYIGNASNTIYRVDPTTKALAPPHITSASANASRFLTYDPTLDSGSGGFWTGNFNTDIDAISMSGTVLTTIAAATHTLGGMYGAAFDNLSPGGPYLWVFHQGGTNQTQLTALQLPAGTPTIYDHDVLADIQSTYSLTSSLAGGAFITDQISSGNTSIVCLAQGTPVNVVVALEIDIAAALEDVEVTSVIPQKGYTQIPSSQVFAETFDIDYRNAGTVAADTIYADIDYLFNGGLISSETVYATSIASGATGTLNSTAFTPLNGTGTYTIDVTLRPDASLNDSNPDNDTLSFSFMVTDSVFARDDNIPDGGNGYAISSIDWGYGAALYELAANDTCAGIWVNLATPVQDDTTYAIIYSINAGTPDTEIATGDITIINSTQNIYYLQFSSPVALTAGDYAFGLYEGVGTTINLAQSNTLLKTGVNFFYTSGSGWMTSGIATTRFIRPILTNSAASSAIEENNQNFIVYPNPANESITISFAANTSINQNISISDLSGRVVLNDVIPAGSLNHNVNLEALNQGVYLLVIDFENTQSIQKIIIE